MSKRVAIVTGAARGIGRAIAEAFAQDGTQVVVADLNKDQGQVVADATGGDFVMVNLALRDDCHRLVNETLTHYGRIDLLVNNAGMQHIDSIEMFPVDIWNKMLAVMLTAPFLLTKYVWPTMKATGRGRIVNIGSLFTAALLRPFRAHMWQPNTVSSASHVQQHWKVERMALLPMRFVQPMLAHPFWKTKLPLKLAHVEFRRRK